LSAVAFVLYCRARRVRPFSVTAGVSALQSLLFETRGRAAAWEVLFTSLGAVAPKPVLAEQPPLRQLARALRRLRRDRQGARPFLPLAGPGPSHHHADLYDLRAPVRDGDRSCSGGWGARLAEASARCGALA